MFSLTTVHSTVINIQKKKKKKYPAGSEQKNIKNSSCRKTEEAKTCQSVKVYRIK
jgi:hypothetical protein